MDERATLADFLRAARGRVTPADVGLVTAGFGDLMELSPEQF
jgi:hypothetical protein